MNRAGVEIAYHLLAPISLVRLVIKWKAEWQVNFASKMDPSSAALRLVGHRPEKKYIYTSGFFRPCWKRQDVTGIGVGRSASSLHSEKSHWVIVEKIYWDS